MENSEQKKWESLVPASVRPRLQLNCALHRFFSFPRQFKTLFDLDSHELAKCGLLCSPEFETISCHFCYFTAKLDHNVDDRLNKQHLSCPGTSNDDVSFPKTVNYQFESHRLYSLLLNEGKVPYVAPYDVAATGLFYYGQNNDDTCECYFCHLRVNKWVDGDTPEIEHKEFNPNCRFLKAPENQDNTKIGDENMNTQSDSRVARTNTSADKVTNDEMEHLQPNITDAQEGNVEQPNGQD